MTTTDTCDYPGPPRWEMWLYYLGCFVAGFALAAAGYALTRL